MHSSPDSSAAEEPNDQASWLWPESAEEISNMAGLYTHHSFISSSALNSPLKGAGASSDYGSKERNGSTTSMLTTTLSNLSFNTSSDSSGPAALFEHHPGTLISTLESPLGSPTSNNPRKTSMFSPSHPGKSSFRTYRGRRYYSDERCPYLLPCDIPELNRQSLKHLLYKEVFGRIQMADIPDLVDKSLPYKVLDLGCGTGCWMASMHDELTARGFTNVKFVGVDVVPVHAPMPGVDFTFIQHDVTKLPLPFANDEFDYVFLRDLTLCLPDTAIQSECLSDALRVLKEGGIYEAQCTDLTIRTLSETKAPRDPKSSAYNVTASTELLAETKNHFVDVFNKRLVRSCQKRNISPVPMAQLTSNLLMEGNITKNHNKRLALPLDEVWWEADMLGGGGGEHCVSPKDNSICFDYSRRNSTSLGKMKLGPSPLTEEAKAVRYMARLIFVQFIESMEPFLREDNDIPQDDWDRFFKDMTADFFQKGGLRHGECIEFGAFWGIKKTCC